MNSQLELEKYRMMYQKYLFDMLLKSMEELIDLHIENEEEFIKNRTNCK